MSDGLFTNAEMVDEIIKRLNEVSVSGIRNVVSLANAFSMLNGLKNGIAEESKANSKKIELLKEQINRLTKPHIDEEGGDIIGGEHYDLKFGSDDNNGEN